MRGLNFDRKMVVKIAILMVISAVVTAFNFRTLGYKDSAMLFLATMALISAIYLIFNDTEKSIIIFIASFPVLVTARKAFNIDFLFLKITYESIYITILFIASIKKIIKLVKDSYRDGKTFDFSFLIFMGIFAIFALNSVLFSKNAFGALSHTFISVLIPMMFALSLASNFKGKDIKGVYYALILMCDFSCFYGFFQMVSNGLSIRGAGAKRGLITFGYHNVNVFAGIAILVFPLILDMFLYGKKKGKEGLFIILSLAINALGLFVSYTRGAWIALLVSVFVVLISRRYRYFIYGLGGLMLVGIRPIARYILRRGTSTTLLTNESTIARIQSMFASFIIIFKYPFGAGSGSYPEMYKNHVTEGYLMIPEWFRMKIKVAKYNMEAAHNLWLQIGSELGIVSMFSFLGIVLNRFVTAIKNFKICRGETAAIVAFTIYSLLTGIEFEHKGIITGTLVLWIIFMLIELKTKGCSSNEGIS